MEKTFIMVKPDHVELADKILEELDQYGMRTATARVDSVPKDIIEDHYSTHKGKFFYEFTVQSFVDKPVVVAVYEGEGIIQKLRDIMGPTDPIKAPEHTIRGRYSKDSMQQANAENRPARNVLHGSDSIEQAEREINVWKRYLF